VRPGERCWGWWMVMVMGLFLKTIFRIRINLITALAYLKIVLGNSVEIDLNFIQNSWMCHIFIKSKKDRNCQHKIHAKNELSGNRSKSLRSDSFIYNISLCCFIKASHGFFVLIHRYLSYGSHPGAETTG
jgi:hypothetical protein